LGQDDFLGQSPTARPRSDSTSWTKEDFVKLKDVVKELVPLIRFVSISSADFCYKVMPYKRIIPKDLFKKIMYFYLDPNYMAESGKLLCPRGRGSSCEVNSTLMNDQHIQWILKQISKVSQESAEQKPDYKLELLYRGTRDGFTPADFHKHCDNKGATVAVMKVAGTTDLLGGYSPISWTSPLNDKFVMVKSNKSFIFSFKNSSVDDAIFSTVVGSNTGVCHWASRGVSFGTAFTRSLHTGNGGHSFNAKASCYCQNSKDYSTAIYSTYGLFAVDEYEVFQVLFESDPHV